MARVIAWRIHHVAYVENLNPLVWSNFSTARIGGVQSSGCLVAGDDPLRQLDLERGVEQLHLADLLEVHVHRVGGRPPEAVAIAEPCLLYTSPSPRDGLLS